MRIWQRLWWKEFRESSPFVLIGVVLPLVCLIFPKFRGDIVALPLTVIMIMVIAWASARAHEKRDSGLPISVPLRLASRYLLPTVGVMLIGVSLGCLVAFRQHESVHLDIIPLIVGMGLFVFLLCTLLSSVYAMIPAAVAGIIFFMFCFTDSARTHEAYWIVVRVLCVVSITAVFWEGYRGKRRVLIGRIALLLLMALALCWGEIRDCNIRDYDIGSLFHLSSSLESTDQTIVLYAIIFESDGTLDVDYDHSQKGKICLLDERIPQRYFISPERIASPRDYLCAMNCLDHRVMLFAVQAPRDAHIRVMAWDMRTGQVTERFRFTGWRDMMADGYFDSHSPDNRYLILSVNSRLGSGNDFWLLDLQRNRATLVVPNAGRGQQNHDAVCNAIWTPNRLILQLDTRNLSVDLQTLRVAPLRIGGMP